MARRRPDPLKLVGRWLEGASPLEAARRIAHPPPDLARELERLQVDRARLVVDAFEAPLQAGVRKDRGVFYTPPAIIDAMLDRVPLEGELLDPAAGAGAFLLALVRRLGASVLDRLQACDLDPQALEAAALALTVELGPDESERIDRWRRTRTFALDFLRGPWPGIPPRLIVGNPPYGRVAGELPESQRGERDVYAAFVRRSLEVVAPGGTVALLVPDTWLTNRDAEGFRHHLVDASGVERVVDFGKPFASARDTRVHALVLRRDANECLVESERDDRLEPMAPVSRDTLRESAGRGWFLYRTSAEARVCAAMERRSEPLSARFEVIYGLRTGDNARWLSDTHGPVAAVGGLNIEAYDRRGTPRRLVDPAAFAGSLTRQQGRWKVGIQRIRTNSRTSWRRWVEAAPLTPDEIGLDSLTLLAERDASGELSDAVCGLLGVLNSSVLNRWYRLHFTDVNVKPVYLTELPIPPLTSEFASLVRRRLASPGDVRLERGIDRLVADAYGLDDAALAVLEEAFWQSELALRPMPSLDEALEWAAGALADTA